MSIDPIFWLIAAVGFLVLEGMTFSMVSVWFAAGSAAALLSCLFHPPFKVQAPGDTLAPGQSCRVTEIHSTLLIVEPVLTESSTH